MTDYNATQTNDDEYAVLSEYVAVPRSELENLEKARMALWEFAERHNVNQSVPVQMELTNITEVMWHLANRKWSPVDPNGEK